MTNVGYSEVWGGDEYSSRAVERFVGVRIDGADGIQITGTCPRCNDPMQATLTQETYRSVIEQSQPDVSTCPVVCACTQTHSGSNGESGCGLGWYMAYRVDGSEVTLVAAETPGALDGGTGHVRTDAARADALALQSALATELPSVRSAAGSWSKGVGAALAALLGFGLIKGPSDISALPHSTAVAVGILLVLALVVGAAAVGFLLRAQHGSVWPVRLRGLKSGQTAARLSDHAESHRAMRSLRVGLLLTGLATLSLVAAVGTSWFGATSSTPVLKVVDSRGTTWCGEVTGSNAGSVSLKLDGGVVIVNTTGAQQIQPLDKCPSASTQ